MYIDRLNVLYLADYSSLEHMGTGRTMNGIQLCLQTKRTVKGVPIEKIWKGI